MNKTHSETLKPITGIRGMIKGIGLPPLIIVFICLLIWGLFYPANMSPDSFKQYSQAVTRKYNDWHPPIMAIIVSFFLRIGGTLGTFMLIQCISGGLGVYILAKTFIEITFSGIRSTSKLALFVFVILLLPVSPLPCYLMTFWKDAWCMILFCWILATAMILYKKGGDSPVFKFYALYIVLMSLSVLAMLIRHNAIVIMPSIICMSWMILYHKRMLSFRKSLFLCMIPLILYIGIQQGQYRLFSIERKHPEQQIMALDLVGMIIEEPDIRSELPYTSQHLTKDYKLAYKFGSVNTLIGREPEALDETYRYGSEMINEYKQSIKKFPFIWLKVKIRAFHELIKPYRTAYWYQLGMVRNGFKMEPNRMFEPIRTLYDKILRRVLKFHILRLFSGVHLVWISFNILWIVLYLNNYLKHKKTIHLFPVIILSIPFLYYMSYIPAMIGLDFRFMYPSTLCMQIITISYVAGRIFMRIYRDKPDAL